MGFINPFSDEGYFGRLIGEFGIRYFLMVAMVYGCNQAIAYTWGNFGRNFWFSDAIEDGGLDLSPATTGEISSFANIPWQIKAIYGIASDAFAIRNYHRKYYIMIAISLAISGWLVLGLLPNPGTFTIMLFLLFTNLGIAMPDVMIDASVAENCQKHPAYAVDLQSLCWGAYGMGAACANLSAGFLNVALGPRTLMTVTALVPLVIFFPTMFNWLNEEPDYEWRVARDKFLQVFKDAVRCGDNADDFDSYRVSGEGAAAIEDRKLQRETDRQNGKLYILALVLVAVSIGYGSVANSIDGTLILFISYVGSVGIVLASLYYFQKGISMDLVRACMYIFLSGALQPRSYVVFYWMRDRSGNCCEEAYNKAIELNKTVPDFCEDDDFVARPCVDDEFLSAINVVGNMMMIVGIVLYNKWLSHMSYRKIWMISQALLLVVSMLDFVWVNRWNLDIGIPDKVQMLLGDEVIIEIVDRFDTMPFFILAAKLCPAGLEATLFAMIMGLSNFGGTMGIYLGSIVLSVMEVEQNEFNLLSEYILLRNSTRLLVLIMIPFLVPNGSPQDPSPYYKGDIDEGEDEIKRRSIEEEVIVEKAKRFSMEK